MDKETMRRIKTGEAQCRRRQYFVAKGRYVVVEGPKNIESTLED